MGALPAELQDLLDQIEACERDARALVEGLRDGEAHWQSVPGKTWSVAQCLDHLRRTNEFYVRDFLLLVERAREQGLGPFAGLSPTWLGQRFVATMEPPPPFRARAPRSVTPISTVRLDDLLPAFVASHDAYRSLVRAAADVDVNRVVGRNPFFPAFRMRLATVLRVIPAHDRRHLWQARRVREQSTGGSTPDRAR